MTDDIEDRPEIVQKRARALFWQRLIVALVVLWMVSTQSLLVWAAVEGHFTRQVLLDCTAPSGDCYKQGQKQTGKVVDQINHAGDQRAALVAKYARLAAACADKPGTQTPQQIERCIHEEE